MSKENIPFYAILVIFVLSLVSTIYLLGIRLISLVQGNANPGRIISIILLIFYGYYLINSLYLFSKLKKDGIEKGVTTMYLGIILIFWLYLLAPIILAEDSATKIGIIKNSAITLLINFAVSITILVYLKRSKEIRKILVAK